MENLDRRKTSYVPICKFEHLIFDHDNEENVVSLVDKDGFIILRGYGVTVIEAINDLHHNLI